MVVVLPAPLGPSSPTTSPCPISRSTSSTSFRPRYDLLSSTPWSFGILRSFLDLVFRQRARSFLGIHDNPIIRKIEGQLTPRGCAARSIVDRGAPAGEHELSLGSGVVGAVRDAATLTLTHRYPAGGYGARNLLRAGPGPGGGRRPGSRLRGGEEKFQRRRADLGLARDRIHVRLQPRPRLPVPVGQRTGTNPPEVRRRGLIPLCGR